MVADSIQSLADQKTKRRVASLVAGLPTASEDTNVRIGDRKTDFLQNASDVSRGAALFAKNCAVCHQVAGKGKKVGPNLDGIGNRGLDRLLEDILAPDRNVDVAFRSTTVVKTDGKLVNGFSKGFDGARLILVNSKGEQISIAKDEIDEQVLSRRSPMPDNVAQIFTKEEFRHLIAWLLSLRK